MKKRKKDKDPNNLRAQRGDLRAQLRSNLDIVTVEQHRPWTYVHFHTSYKDPYTSEDIKVGGWGVSKICWPDKWDEEYGVDMAVERGLAWMVKRVIPPTVEPDYVIEGMSADELRKLERSIMQQQALYTGNMGRVTENTKILRG